MPSRLALALLASLLLHVLVLSGVNLEMPDMMAEHDSIDVILALPLPKPVENPVVIPKPLLRQVPPVRKKQVKVQPQEMPPSLPPPQVAEQAPVPVEHTDVPSPVIEPAPGVESAPGIVEDSGPAAEAEESRAPRGYRRVVAEYRLFRGQGPSVGVVRHTYRVANDGTYRITATAEASGLVSLFVRGKFVQQSDGTVTDRGLRPQHFVYSRGDDAAKEQKATFYWATGLLTMEIGQKRESTVPLIDGAQDMLSFMYQFMFVPPLEQMQIAVTNGKKFRVYNYAFEGEETLQMDIGNVRTFHIAKHGNDGDEKTELWLAPDYRYLPVKISQTEKDGTVTEQIVKHIDVE